MLEECGCRIASCTVNILRGEQFAPEYLRISPNNKIPAIVDQDAPGGALRCSNRARSCSISPRSPVAFCRATTHGRYDVLQWLYWQVGGLGPMAGQAHHFRAFASESVPYGITALHRRGQPALRRAATAGSRIVNTWPANTRSRTLPAGPGCLSTSGRARHFEEFPLSALVRDRAPRPAVRAPTQPDTSAWPIPRRSSISTGRPRHAAVAQREQGPQEGRLERADTCTATTRRHSRSACSRCSAIKRARWRWVETPMMLPKEDLVALTGGYRGTPVLQIGADVYIDSQRIARELESRFPAADAFPGGERRARLRDGQVGRRVLSRRSAHGDRADESGVARGIPRAIARSFFPTSISRR